MVKFKIINGEVDVNKEITKLDQFALDIIKVVKKYTNYVIISGYVSIFFGRSRGTEDIDMFIKPMEYDKFKAMYLDFLANGFEFNIGNSESLYYDYLKDNTSINVWVKNKPLLRMEIKFATKVSQLDQLNNPIIIKFKNQSMNFAQIEGQIAYKRYIAKSQKDLEDARHLEIVFDNLDEEKIKYYKTLFLDEFNEN